MTTNYFFTRLPLLCCAIMCLAFLASHIFLFIWHYCCQVDLSVTSFLTPQMKKSKSGAAVKLCSIIICSDGRQLRHPDAVRTLHKIARCWWVYVCVLLLASVSTTKYMYSLLCGAISWIPTKLLLFISKF